MSPHGHVLGIDFGTSNSAAGYLSDGKPRLVEMALGQTTIPSTFFFDFETQHTLVGEPANQALLAGQEGRFMRGLKRVLGTTLMHERRQILNERVTFVDIIARFLRHIKTRAETEAGLAFDSVVAGRPVVFHGHNDPREAQAETDLRACFQAAGFQHIEFKLEPEAAAIASGALDQTGEIGLIVDIGGGTSDFSLFKSGRNGVEILSSHGVRIGGTDFDRSISIDRVMPLLGMDTYLRKDIGPGSLPVPKALFNDIATWEKIPFLYTANNLRLVGEMARLSKEPTKIRRLKTVLENELGHDLAFAVEEGKKAANFTGSQSQINLEEIEKGLFVSLSFEALVLALAGHAQNLRVGAMETLLSAGIETNRVEKVIYVGGSSLMLMVSETMKSVFPQAKHSFSEVFTAVTDGLVETTRI